MRFNPFPRLAALAAVLSLVAGLASAQLASDLPASVQGGYVVQTTSTAFEDVLEGVGMAIQERGMYINNVMNMGDMLERTGRDLGFTDPVLGQAQSIEFCSALLSREMIAERAEWILNCPFIIAVYTLPDDERTYLAYRELPPDLVAGSPALQRAATMLRDVAQAALDW